MSINQSRQYHDPRMLIIELKSEGIKKYNEISSKHTVKSFGGIMPLI